MEREREIERARGMKAHKLSEDRIPGGEELLLYRFCYSGGRKRFRVWREGGVGKRGGARKLHRFFGKGRINLLCLDKFRNQMASLAHSPLLPKPFRCSLTHNVFSSAPLLFPIRYK